MHEDRTRASDLAKRRGCVPLLPWLSVARSVDGFRAGLCPRSPAGPRPSAQCCCWWARSPVRPRRCRAQEQRELEPLALAFDRVLAPVLRELAFDRGEAPVLRELECAQVLASVHRELECARVLAPVLQELECARGEASLLRTCV